MKATPQPAEPCRSSASLEGRRIEVRGTVQGVGFRPWVYRLAHEHGIAGRVCNDVAGVTIEVFGPAEVLDSFIDRQMIARRLQSPLAHGVGRYFDAIGAIVLGRATAHYEGQVAMEWNFIADPTESAAYPFLIHQDAAPWTIDLRPLVREAVGDLLAARPPSMIAAKFHHSIAGATAEVVRRIARRFGPLPVVLTGGCFQNALLTEAVLGRLAPQFRVYRHRQVPSGDGGLALGQALVAGAIAEQRYGRS